MKKIAIVGGGAAGAACAVLLARAGKDVVLLERGERLCRKLSASGNGQGNVTNRNMGADRYFSDDREKVARILARFGSGATERFLSSMGGVFLPDARGRVYPVGRQASAVTDLLRRELFRLGAETVLGAKVTEIVRGARFSVVWEGGRTEADAVVLAAGGAAAPSFGTDGSAYALARALGHTVVPPVPALVPLETDPAAVRGLRGIRVDAGLTVRRGGKEVYSTRGDVLFADYGVSGDAVFRASSYAQRGDILELDLLPDVSEGELGRVVTGEEGCLLCVVNNGLGRVLERRAAGDGEALRRLLKAYPLVVRGTLGFERAQVTRGGVPLAETDETLGSTRTAGLYFAGEILNVDGECGGYNLHWAFASAHAVSEALSC